MAGGWWYLWTDGGVGGWGLVARACWWERCAVPVAPVCAVPVLCPVDGV